MAADVVAPDPVAILERGEGELRVEGVFRRGVAASHIATDSQRHEAICPEGPIGLSCTAAKVKCAPGIGPLEGYRLWYARQRCILR